MTRDVFVLVRSSGISPSVVRSGDCDGEFEMQFVRESETEIDKFVPEFGRSRLVEKTR